MDKEERTTAWFYIICVIFPPLGIAVLCFLMCQIAWYLVAEWWRKF